MTMSKGLPALQNAQVPRFILPIPGKGPVEPEAKYAQPKLC